MASGYWNTISGRSVASAMRLKCASAICGDWPSVNGAGGNTSSAEAPPCAAMRAMRAASMLPSAQMPFTSGSRPPISSCAMSSTRRCSSKVQEATSVECALMVMADRPSTAATSRRCLRKLASSIERSFSNGSSTAGITPVGNIIRVPWHGLPPYSIFRRFDPRSALASIAEFGRQAIGGGAHLARALLQGLDRQPPDRAGNADGAGHLAAEIAHRQRHAAHLGVELAVVERHAGAAHLCDLAAQLLRRR